MGILSLRIVSHVGTGVDGNTRHFSVPGDLDLRQPWPTLGTEQLAYLLGWFNPNTIYSPVPNKRVYTFILSARFFHPTCSY